MTILQNLDARGTSTAPYVVRRPRLLMTVDAVGGIWRYAMELARALVHHDIAIYFAGLGPPPSREQVVEAEGLGTLLWLDQPLDWMAHDAAALEGIPAAIGGLVEDQDIDLVHLNVPSQAARLDVRVPTVAVSHSCVASWWRTVRGTGLPEEWAWQEKSVREGFSRADAIVAPSGAHAHLLTKCYGPLPGLEVVHNGISSVLHRRDKEPFAFAAGRWWDEGKNGRIFNEVAARLDWPLVLAGSATGPSGEAAGYEGETLGELPHSRVIDFMQCAGIVVSPSLYEPFGLAALEGARAGAALALADIPVYRELWQDAAVFFDPRDGSSLHEALTRLISDPGLRSELGERALASSRRYSPHLQAEKMVEIYRSLSPVFSKHSSAEA
ncbi:glycosyltransferase family 4 protein [Nitratireductor thuwali]|uniref:D-inositol-3-phosphate glycosyltransferase n=1 Tax=Nitratireductor thuwali TaxID=2267699 RepID=A0ABY5MFE3_9HYPH|nr:D-inositol-3-phosphate glycosyltransferase [Nitratireductor thuwali]